MSNEVYDVEYSHVEEDKQDTIRGKILYYSTSQVATLLNETDSKIRYYTSVFDDILHIEISNKQRRYTQDDIEKLKFIIELKDSGMTIKQIQEYAQNVDFESENGIQIKESNPLSIQALAKALLEEQQIQMTSFKKEIVDLISLQFKNQIEALRIGNEEMMNTALEQVSLTVDNVVSEKLEENLKEVKTHISESAEKTIEKQEENKKILEELTLTVSEMKTSNEKLVELLNNPEELSKVVKNIKKEDDKFLSRITKKLFK